MEAEAKKALLYGAIGILIFKVVGYSPLEKFISQYWYIVGVIILLLIIYRKKILNGG